MSLSSVPESAASRLRLPGPLGDAVGGIVAALVAIPQAVPFGMMVFAPLGAEHVWLGIASGLISGLIGSLVCVLASPIRTQICGPRAATSIVLASLVSQIAGHPALRGADGTVDPGAILVIVGLCVAIAGLVQVALGAFRVGQAIKLIPHPVLTGFLIGLSFILIARQIPPLLGLGYTPDFWAIFIGDTRISLVPAAVGAITLTAMIFGRRYLPSIPALVSGLAIGWLAAVALGFLTGYRDPGIGATGPLTLPLVPVDAGSGAVLWSVFTGETQLVATIILFALIVAIVSSIETLLALVSYDAATANYSDSNRELVAQGLSNVAVGAFGGITSVGATVRTMANRNAGGRTALSVVVHSGALAVVLLAGWMLEAMPQAVLAGIMLHVAISMTDWWPLRLAGDVMSERTRRRGQAATLAVVVLTAAVTVVFDALIAVGVGVVLSILVFARDMSRPVMRRIVTGAMLRSRKVRPVEEAERLGAVASKTQIVQLDGPMFFGTADTVRKWVEDIDPMRTRQVIFDVNRVLDFDVTSAVILRQTAQRLAESGVAMAIAGLVDGDPRRNNLRDFGLVDGVEWFDDLDEALEWAEDRLLSEHGGLGDRQKAVVDDSVLLVGLSPEQKARIRELMIERSYARGEPLFAEGDPGEELFVLMSGTVRIELQRNGRSIRLSSISPGVVFGEMALLDERPRSADATAETRVLVTCLSREAVRTLMKSDPAIAQVLMMNLAREIAQRLRLTNQILAGGLEG